MAERARLGGMGAWLVRGQHVWEAGQSSLAFAAPLLPALIDQLRSHIWSRSDGGGQESCILFIAQLVWKRKVCWRKGASFDAHQGIRGGLQLAIEDGDV